MAESPYTTCAEDIALLHFLHKIPEPPSVNKDPWTTHDAAQYALPFETERSLVGALAFMSSITDNPNCITAVCVKEHPGAQTLEVHVAINKQNHKDNDNILETICRGFDAIFVRLRDPSGCCESEVLKQAIRLCKSRILCRLGYEKKANSKRRSPLDVVLEQARRSLSQLRSGIPVVTRQRYRQGDSITEAQVQQFLTGSAELLKILRSWKLHQTDDELCTVVDGLWAFVALDGWKAVLELIPDSLMNPSSRQSLTTMLRKGAKYRHAARTVYRVAKKHPVARRMAAVAVRLPSSAFQRPPPPASLPSLNATSSRIFAGRKKHHNVVGRICQALNADPAAASAAFATQTRRTLAEGKLHAEVQLLGAILDSQPSSAPPRVVRASKDACYLCHRLLRAHAQLYTPRCHGRLYPGWRLPATPAFRALRTALNKALEQKIRDGAETLLKPDGGWRQKRGVYPDPCESTCSTAVLSDTTVAVGGPDPEHGAESLPELALDAPITDKGHDAPGSSSSSSTIRDGAEQTPGSEAQSAHSRSWSVGESYALAQGQVIVASLPAAESAMYTADALRMQLEYTAEEQPPEMGVDVSRKLQYRVQQLTSQETETLREESCVSVVDVASLAAAEERTYKLDEQADLYLGAGDCIFRLTLQPSQRP